MTRVFGELGFAKWGITKRTVPLGNTPSDISPYPARLRLELGVGLLRLGLG